MNELIQQVATPWASLGMTLLFFGFAPPAVLRVFVRTYPLDHPRRVELVRELDEVPFIKRPIWVSALIPVCVDEGLCARFGRRRIRKAQRAELQLIAIGLIESGSSELVRRRRGLRRGTVKEWHVVVVDGKSIKVAYLRRRSQR